MPDIDSLEGVFGASTASTHIGDIRRYSRKNYAECLTRKSGLIKHTLRLRNSLSDGCKAGSNRRGLFHRWSVAINAGLAGASDTY